jgi:hypothetical protein
MKSLISNDVLKQIEIQRKKLSNQSAKNEASNFALVIAANHSTRAVLSVNSARRKKPGPYQMSEAN